ncbi:MAG: methyltransferase domain-containing protein [Deltaproteobacteria bacterium]|nr:methyltransferase domain-containing protein [Deltaproteobacteria bacterium]
MKRSYEKELMDVGGNQGKLLAEDLRNLRILNRFLSGRRCVMLGLKHALRRQQTKRFSLLDVGTGSADIPAAILEWGRRKGVDATIVGLEAETLTAKIAAGRTNHLPNISIIQGDADNSPFSPGSFDYVVASQLLHHFPEEKIIELLKRWARIARKGIVVGDLVRHPIAYHGIRLLTKLTTRNIMTLKDAPLSVRRALTFNEWRGLFKQAQVGPVEMYSVFPFRMAAVVTLGGR